MILFPDGTAYAGEILRLKNVFKSKLNGSHATFNSYKKHFVNRACSNQGSYYQIESNKLNFTSFHKDHCQLNEVQGNS